MTALETIAYPDAAVFLERCAPFLAVREAQHCVMLGFALAARDRSSPAAGTPSSSPVPAMAVTAVATADGAPRFVAGVTDKAALLSAVDRTDDADALVGAMVDAVADRTPHLPGFEGDPQIAALFARRWEAATGRRSRRVLRERVYEARAVDPPDPPVRGRARRMAASDIALVGAWVEAFVAEAMPHEGPIDGTAVATPWADDPGRDVRLWEVDGRPVSMALAAWPTLTGIRVSYVYTPPADRRRGYASAVTAAVTAAQLEAGRRACFLYTDLANPTSNAIYQAVGYRPVADVDRYVIDPSTDDRAA